MGNILFLFSSWGHRLCVDYLAKTFFRFAFYIQILYSVNLIKIKEMLLFVRITNFHYEAKY